MAPVFLTANTLAAKSCPFFVFSFIPGKSFLDFPCYVNKGVLFKSIFTSFPNPDAALSAIALKKLPFSFDPTCKEYYYQLLLLFGPLIETILTQ